MSGNAPHVIEGAVVGVREGCGWRSEVALK